MRIFLFNLIWLSVFITSEAIAQAGDFDMKIEEAMNLSEAGDHLGAYAILSAIIQERPYFAEAYYFRGIVRDRVGDKEGALTDYNILLELDPTHTEGVFARGILRYQLQQYDQAVADLTQLLQLPQRETTTILYQKPVFQSGITGILSQQSAAKDYIYQYLGLAYLGLKDYETAKTYFDKAIDARPWDPEYFLNRGRSYQKSGDLEKAKEDFLIAQKLNPNHPLTNQYLAEIAIASGDKEAADLYYSNAIGSEPEFAETYKQRGYQRLKSEQWKDALADFDKALELEADDTKTMQYRAYVLEKSGKTEMALSQYQKVIEVDPMESNAHFGKGNILYKSKKYDLAIGAYTLALHYRDDFREAYYQRGLTYHQLNNNEEACRDLKKANELGLDIAADAIKKICR